jgi:hypothetical protein
MLISETGSEGAARPSWLEYVATESARAMDQGCELHGITLYPILDHPGWEDDRRCENGLWGYADDHGQRATYTSLAESIHAHTPRLLAARRALFERRSSVRVYEPGVLQCQT